MINKRTILGVIFFFFYLTHQIKSTDELKSKLNKLELDNFKYELDIGNKLISFDDMKVGEYSVPIRASNGQTYLCELPENHQIDKIGEDVDLSEFDDESQDFSIASLFFETSSSLINQKKTPKPQINFTLVDEKVKAYMTRLNESNICLLKNLGWWTYEFCFGKYAAQYHLLSNGSIDGVKISLGNFSLDYDWLKANMTNYPTSSGVLYHEQYFEAGSHCELSGRPRRSIVKIYCDELGSNSIDLISEIETCVYEIHVNSYLMCSVPQFRKAPQNFQLSCNPVVTRQIYEHYIQKKATAAVLAEAEKSIKPIEETSLDDLNDISIEMLTTTPGSHYDHKLIEVLDEMSELEAAAVFDDADNEVLLEEEKARLKAFDDLLKKEKEALNDLKSNAMEYEKAIKNLKKQTLDGTASEEEILEARSKVLDTLKPIKVKQENIDKVIENLGHKLSELVSEKKAEEDHLPVNENQLKMKVTELGSNEGNPTVESTQNPNLAKLEKTIAEKLSKSSKLSGQLKKGGEIKVKIITFEPNGAGLNSLDEHESNSLTELLSSLFEGQTDKVKELKTNYDSLYTVENLDNLVLDNANKKEVNKEKRNPRDVSDFFLSLMDDSAQDSEADNENEKLIIF